MSLFFPDFTKPGPGVPPDAPRKKGIARLLEIACRDAGRLWCAGALAMVSMIPLVCAQLFQLIPMLTLSVLGGMLASPQLCGLADTVLRSLRDEPYFWWHIYRRAWKRNTKATLIPGAVWGVVTGAQLYTLIHFFDAQFTLSTIIILAVGLVVVQGAFLWVWPQLALAEIPASALLKNSLLLFLGNLGRSLGASFLVILCAALAALYLPYSLILLLLFNLWPVLTAAWLILYPRLEEAFDIEESVRAAQEKDRQEYERNGQK